MKRNAVCLLIFALFVTMCGSSFAEDAPQVKVGVVFTSDTFDIPDSLADLVTGLFGNALSSFSNVSIVNQNSIKSASRSLGFNQSHLSTPQNLKAIGEEAGLNFVVWTRINYDFEKAARAEASRALGKFLKLPKQNITKHMKPDFDVRVIDVASAKFVFDNKFDLDLFSGSMKNALLSGALSGGSSLSLGSLDTSVLQAIAQKLAPLMQTAMNEAALLAMYKDTGNTEGIINTVVDLAHGQTHDTKTVFNQGVATYTGITNDNSSYEDYYENDDDYDDEENEIAMQTATAAAPQTTSVPSTSTKSKNANYENRSTDPAKVVKSYGVDGKLSKELIKRHKEANSKSGNQAKLDAYAAIFNWYPNDYLAAYNAALAEFNMGHGARAIDWCKKALAINSRYHPASQLLKRAKGL